jgi:glycosyltransferase involved in cell wall biosynthesis
MITIIIPTYKPKEYIYECLSSIAIQDIGSKNYIVMIVLNGEKYPYYSQILNFIKEFPNFHLYHISQKGVSNARNFALNMIKEGYVVFIDDDDKISSNYLSGLLNIIDNSSISISNERTFYNGLPVEKGYLAKKFEKLKDRNKSIISCRSFLSTACFKMIPLKIIGTRRFNTNFANGEDALFMALISDRIKSMQFADKDVVYYRRIRENSASQKKRNITEKFLISVRLLFCYITIYLKTPLKYNFLFYLNRCIAVFKTLFIKDF